MGLYIIGVEAVMPVVNCMGDIHLDFVDLVVRYGFYMIYTLSEVSS